MFSLLPRRVHSALVAPLLLPFLLLFEGDNIGPLKATDASYSVHGILHASFPFTDPIFIVSWGAVSHGTLTVAAHFNGFSQESFAYEPNYGYTGDDSFTYHACNSLAQCEDGTINLSVVNNAPHALADSYTLHGILQHGGDFPVTINDSDPDHDPIRVVSVTQASNGTFTYNFSYDSFTYQPRAGFAGTDSVTYTICDNLGLCDSTTITLIVVNHTPVANHDDYTTQMNQTLFVRGPDALVQNDFDADNDPFSVTGTTQGFHGRVTYLTGEGILIYEPNQNFVGRDSFSYTICDYLGACATGTATVDVQGDAPTPTPTPTPVAPPTPTPPPPPPPSPTPTPTPVEPLIFIPGIAGSKLNERLDDGSSFNRWPGVGSVIPPIIAKKDNLNLDPSLPQASIFAPDIIRTMPIRLLFKKLDEQMVYRPLLDMLSRNGYREYKVNNDPNRRTDEGCDLSQKNDDPAANPNLFVFAYDWRKSNIENASLLNSYVRCVQKFYPDKRINILTHSMGGLVARRYILDHLSDHDVDKLITIAAPWLGAPKAINVLETGQFDVPQIVLSSDLLKRLVEFFKSVHEIMPSKNYFALGGDPFGEKNWDINGDRRLTAKYTYDQFARVLDNDFPRSKPGMANGIFHDNPGQDNWKLDNSGIRYFHFYGVKFATDTIGKLTAVAKPVCDPAGDCKQIFDFEKSYVKGDGTVPELSAKRIAGTSNLNAKDISPKVFRGSGKQAGHLELTQNPDVWAEIISALSETQSSEAISTPQLKGARAHHVLTKRTREGLMHEDETEQSAYYVTISGVAQVVVKDSDSNSNEPIPGSPFGDRLPDVTYDLGVNSVSIVTPSDQSYSLTFQSTGEPVTITVLKGIGTVSPTESIRYLDLNLPAGTSGILKLSPDGVDNLAVDADSDGNYESTLAPTSTAFGDNALDSQPPAITFHETLESGARLLTIGATDDQSGVRIIRYSLDGQKFQPYNAPFNIDACQVRTVYTFADDNVGNRSGVFKYELQNLPPDVSQAFPAFSRLWPPDHRMIKVPILGVTDPDCDPVTITITRITQDESPDGTGEGSTCGDATGVGTSMAELRSERDGTGDGRVYTIYFTAEDTAGGRSQGAVKVGVPKDMSHSAVEDPYVFDSTTCGAKSVHGPRAAYTSHT